MQNNPIIHIDDFAVSLSARSGGERAAQEGDEDDAQEQDRELEDPDVHPARALRDM